MLHLLVNADQMSLSEKELIIYCQKNDAFAQRLLYQLHVKDLLKLCLRYLNNKMDIEDILQHSFEKVFFKIGQFEYKGAGSLKAWIHRITINECLMHLRKSKKFNVSFTDETEWLDERIGSADEESATDVSFELKHVQACISKLPDGYRAVLNLYVFEEMTHEEVADTLGISVNTSKSQLSRARKLLKKLLNSES